MVGKILRYFYVLATCTCFAHDVSDTSDDGIIHQIAANQNTCVIGVAEEKIYLNPNRIYPTEQGLYLNLNDVDYVLLPSLNSDHNGCYVRPVCKRQILNICPGCGQQYFISCKNPNCPLVQRNEERKREKERQKEEDRERKRQEKEEKRNNKK